MRRLGHGKVRPVVVTLIVASAALAEELRGTEDRQTLALQLNNVVVCQMLRLQRTEGQRMQELTKVVIRASKEGQNLEQH